MVTTVLGLVVVAGVIVYGHVAEPAGWVGFANKTVWDYLELLIVPVALAIGGYWLNRAQRERELEVEKQRAQDATLQAYLDKMSSRT